MFYEHALRPPGSAGTSHRAAGRAGPRGSARGASDTASYMYRRLARRGAVAPRPLAATSIRGAERVAVFSGPSASSLHVLVICYLRVCVCIGLCVYAPLRPRKSRRAPGTRKRGCAMRTPVATRRSLSPHWTGTPEYVDRKLEPSAALLSGSTAALSCGIASSMRPTLASLSASSDSTRGGTEMCTTAALPERKKYKQTARGKMSATPRE